LFPGCDEDDPMAEPSAPTYGTPNWEMIGRWLELSPEEDSAFWAVNLMKYKAQAEYADGRDSGLTGQEADDIYTPYGPLEAIGAMIAFAGQVLEQRGSNPTWDRIGIVRYPSRAAFFAMQQRDDFKDQHAHKEAGMDATIVMSCLPVAGAPVAAVPDGGHLVMAVRRGGAPVDAVADGVTPLVRFEVEGVIVGDGRTWDEVRFDHASDERALAALLDVGAAEEAFAVALQPAVVADRLAESITSAP
jgi:hypothetical protein